MIARYCEFADYNSSNTRILQLEFLNLLFKLYLFIYLFFDFDSRFRHLLRRNRQEIKYAVDFVNTGSTNLLIINHQSLIINHHSSFSSTSFFSSFLYNPRSSNIEIN